MVNHDCGKERGITWPRLDGNQGLNRVLQHLHLGESWERRIQAALLEEGPKPADQDRVVGLQQAIESLRKQHVWGDITDEEYRGERTTLERQKTLRLSTAGELFTPVPKVWTLNVGAATMIFLTSAGFRGYADDRICCLMVIAH